MRGLPDSLQRPCVVRARISRRYVPEPRQHYLKLRDKKGWAFDRGIY